MSYKSAKRALQRRQRVHVMVDGFFTWGASSMALCGEGRKNNWSILFTDMIFTDCPCCLVFRGMFIGFIGAALVLFPLMFL